MEGLAEPTPKLVLGLGNPGERYRTTRHNLGFRVVETLAARLGVALDRLECNALVGGGEGLTLALPRTYMNRSGYAARCLVERHGFVPADILVVYDEAQLPLGRLRLRPRGGPGGHRGMESVIRNLNCEEIARLRLGIDGRDGAPAGEELVDYVLSEFLGEELEEVEEMVERGADACQSWLREGPGPTMDRFNA